MTGAAATARAVLLLLGAAGASASAAPQDASGANRPASYRMIWNAQPQGNVGETRVIGPGELAATLVLTPPALFRATQDVRDAQGGVLAPAGTQFVLLASEAHIACTIHHMRHRGAERALFIGSRKRLCLLDGDRDGRFERHFLRVTNAAAYFMLHGRLSGEQQPIEPVALAEEAPAALRDAPVIELRLTSTSRTNRRASLSVSVGGAGEEGFPFLRDWSANRFPAILSAFGGRIEIAPEADGRFRIRTLLQFSVQGMDFGG